MNADHTTIDFRTQDEHEQRADHEALPFVFDQEKAAEIRVYTRSWRQRNGLESNATKAPEAA